MRWCPHREDRFVLASGSLNMQLFEVSPQRGGQVRRAGGEHGEWRIEHPSQAHGHDSSIISSPMPRVVTGCEPPKPARYRIYSRHCVTVAISIT